MRNAAMSVMPIAIRRSFESYPLSSCISNLIALMAVSPLVMGHTTTPTTAMIPPNVPRRDVEMSYTTPAAPHSANASDNDVVSG